MSWSRTSDATSQQAQSTPAINLRFPERDYELEVPREGEPRSFETLKSLISDATLSGKKIKKKFFFFLNTHSSAKQVEVQALQPLLRDVRSTESKKSNPAGWLSFQHQRARGPTQATRQQTRARQAKAVHATATNQSINQKPKYFASR